MIRSEKLDPRIEAYLQPIESGQVKACKDQILLAQHIRDCFATEDIYTDSEQLDHYLDLAKYFPFQEVFPWEAYVAALHLCTYRRSDGMPRWPDALVMIGRGNGKDGFIAWASMCLLSPYNGIRGYDVDICANNEAQAVRPVADVIEALENPEHIGKMKKHFYWTKEQVTGLATRSVMKGLTNSPKGKDGLRSGICIFNEIHQYENYKNIDVFTTGLGKKQHPRRTYCTTNGDVREGPLDNLLEQAADILSDCHPDEGFLPFICRLDSKDEAKDPENWIKANPSLPYRPDLAMEIRKEYREWERNPGQLPAFMTKRMNLPSSMMDIAVTEWDNIAATNKPLMDLKGLTCTIGIDFSSIRDWASVCFHFRVGDLRYDFGRSWLCLRNPDLWRIKAPWREWADRGLLVPVDDVEISPYLLTDYIAEVAQDYLVSMVAVDNFRYALLKDALLSIGFSARDFKNVYLVRPSDIMRIQPVIDSCFNNHWFHWDDNPVLRWATNNTKLVRSGKKEGADTGNYYYAKIEQKSRKTDPFMALVAAMAVEQTNMADDEGFELGSFGV